MGIARSDALDTLLPETSSPRWRRARALTTFLRLLSDDARADGSSPIALSADRAHGELERHCARRLTNAVRGLLRAHVEAALGAETFLWMGESAEVEAWRARRKDGASPAARVGAVAAFWSVLEEYRDERELAHVPQPGESAVQVAGRLLATLAELQAGVSEDSDVVLWEARLARATAGAREAERCFERLTAAATADVTRRRAVAGRVECLLDRGAVGRASAVLEELALAPDRRLAQLRVWTTLCAGDFEEARRRQAVLGPWTGRLPSPLAELRERQPAWIECLAGRAAPSSPAALDASPPGVACGTAAARGWPLERARDRRSVGATCLVAIAFRPGRGAWLVHADVAASLEPRLAAWWADRGAAHAEPGSCEHRAVVRAHEVVEHRFDSARAALTGALDRASARAQAVLPVLGSDGEVAGWLRLEFPHHLVPSAATRAALVRAWHPLLVDDGTLARTALEPGGEERLASSPPSDRGPRVLRARAALGADSSSSAARAFREFVDELGMKTTLRHWWGFEVVDGKPELCTEGGRALGETVAGGGRALARALATRGAVVFDEPVEGLALAPGAASGVVVPLETRAELAGLFVVESTRRRDFRELDVERLRSAGRSFAARLGVARFRDWHRERFGSDVVFDLRSSAFGRRADDFVAAGRSRVPVAITGERGAGKEVVARWLHYESELRDRPLHVVPGGRHDALDVLGPGRALDLEEPATIVFDDVASLPAAAQRQLCMQFVERENDRRARGRARARVRVVFVADASLEELVARDLLVPELGSRLALLELRVPPLRERRSDIPELARVLSAQFAAAEGLAPVTFADEVLALFWRQPWTGNVRELENLVFKLALLHPGEEVGLERVAAVAARFGLRLVERLPSRHPEREELLAALRSTLTGRGTLNKTRAALYLGWDPDTLVARMRDVGLEGDAWSAMAQAGAGAKEEGASAGTTETPSA